MALVNPALCELAHLEQAPCEHACVYPYHCHVLCHGRKTSLGRLSGTGRDHTMTATRLVNDTLTTNGQVKVISRSSQVIF